jgi:hypothetical protein
LTDTTKSVPALTDEGALMLSIAAMHGKLVRSSAVMETSVRCILKVALEDC